MLIDIVSKAVQYLARFILPEPPPPLCEPRRARSILAKIRTVDVDPPHDGHRLLWSTIGKRSVPEICC